MTTWALMKSLHDSFTQLHKVSLIDIDEGRKSLRKTFFSNPESLISNFCPWMPAIEAQHGDTKIHVIAS